jgi:PTH1 family peptidyl-tRNA hydrolase
MNLSGKAVRYWLDKEKIERQHLLVIIDDLDLPFGTLRMKGKGSDGSHNGLKSVTTELGTNDYPRLRFGIGNDFPKGHQVDFVLGRWTASENEALAPRIDIATEMIRSFGMQGIGLTMTQYNNK